MTRRRVHPRWAWGVALAAVLGCRGGKEAIKPSGAEDEATLQAKAKIRPEPREGETPVEYDLNRDNRADVWAYTVKGKDAEGKDFDVLVRKEMDINWDGNVDVTRYYDAQEQMEKEALDLDFDGKVDLWNYYEKGVVIRKERDLDYDGRIDLWLFYERGKIARKERDTNGDGKVDYWEYWEGDQVDRFGEDVDGDGSVDKWTKNPATQAKE